MNNEAVVNIADLRRLAKVRLPKIIFEYLDGGAEDEVTLARSRSIYERVSFVPRLAAGFARPDLSIDLFGERLSVPFMVGPTGMNGIFWRGADLALARSAESLGAGFTLAMAANASIEEVGAATKGVKWFQLYPWGDDALWRRTLERVKSAGFSALVVTVDSLTNGNRERDRRNRFAHNVTLTPRTIIDGMLHPRWLLQVWLRGVPRFENLLETLGPNAGVNEVAAFTRSAKRPDMTWDDLARIRKIWSGPMLIKGVLSAEDARKCVSIGVDGVVVSNHGGRQLDGAITTLEALPRIADAAAGKLTILADGGLRRGSDVVKALALGAQAVVLGRAPLYGVAAGGQQGVKLALQILHDETVRVMSLIGCGSVGDLNTGYLSDAQSWPSAWLRPAAGADELEHIGQRQCDAMWPRNLACPPRFAAEAGDTTPSALGAMCGADTVETAPGRA